MNRAQLNIAVPMLYAILIVASLLFFRGGFLSACITRWPHARAASAGTGSETAAEPIPPGYSDRSAPPSTGTRLPVR